jgi:hypothetical protein
VDNGGPLDAVIVYRAVEEYIANIVRWLLQACCCKEKLPQATSTGLHCWLCHVRDPSCTKSGPAASSAKVASGSSYAPASTTTDTAAKRQKENQRIVDHPFWLSGAFTIQTHDPEQTTLTSKECSKADTRKSSLMEEDSDTYDQVLHSKPREKNRSTSRARLSLEFSALDTRLHGHWRSTPAAHTFSSSVLRFPQKPFTVQRSLLELENEQNNLNIIWYCLSPKDKTAQKPASQTEDQAREATHQGALHSAANSQISHPIKKPRNFLHGQTMLL